MLCMPICRACWVGLLQTYPRKIRLQCFPGQSVLGLLEGDQLRQRREQENTLCPRTDCNKSITVEINISFINTQSAIHLYSFQSPEGYSE